MMSLHRQYYGSKAEPEEMVTMENCRRVVGLLQPQQADHVHAPSAYDLQIQIANLTACVKFQAHEIERLKAAHNTLLNALTMMHGSENLQNIRIEALEASKAGRVS